MTVATPGGKSKSLPPRGAWIEIDLELDYKEAQEVAPPTGSVD